MAEKLDKTTDAVRMQYNRAVIHLGKIVGRLRRGELHLVATEAIK